MNREFRKRHRKEREGELGGRPPFVFLQAAVEKKIAEGEAGGPFSDLSGV